MQVKDIKVGVDYKLKHTYHQNYFGSIRLRIVKAETREKTRGYGRFQETYTSKGFLAVPVDADTGEEILTEDGQQRLRFVQGKDLASEWSVYEGTHKQRQEERDRFHRIRQETEDALLASGLDPYEVSVQASPLARYVHKDGRRGAMVRISFTEDEAAKFNQALSHTQIVATDETEV